MTGSGMNTEGLRERALAAHELATEQHLAESRAHHARMREDARKNWFILYERLRKQVKTILQVDIGEREPKDEEITGPGAPRDPRVEIEGIVLTTSMVCPQANVICAECRETLVHLGGVPTIADFGGFLARLSPSYCNPCSNQREERHREEQYQTAIRGIKTEEPPPPTTDQLLLAALGEWIEERIPGGYGGG
jgi:hypothetical protein